MYGKRYGAVSSGVTRAMRTAATQPVNFVPSYTATLHNGEQLTGVAFYGRHALDLEGFRAYVNGLPEDQYQTATIVMRGQTIRVADIARLSAE
jgi:hypothetical protein